MTGKTTRGETIASVNFAGKPLQETVALVDSGVPKKVASSFYRGETLNCYPYRNDHAANNFLEEYVLKGWLPASPLLDKGTKITAFGSCFATHITKHLSAIGYDLSQGRDPDIYVSRMGEGLVNTYALLGQFEWALENKEQPIDLWHGFKAEGYGYDEQIRLRTRDVFLATEFFIITLGLSEIWYDEVTGGVFWRAVPISAFDSRRHKFRVSTVEENKANLAKMYGLIRRHVPEAQVLFTLSPITLAATFRPVSCITANSVSKAILRAGLDEFLRDNDDDLNRRLFYFPSYEMLQNLFADPLKEDNRHPQGYVIKAIMKTFEAAYCRNETSLADANENFQLLRKRNMSDVANKANPKLAALTAERSAAAVTSAVAAAERRAAAPGGRRRAAVAPAGEAAEEASARDEMRAARRAKRKAEKAAQRDAAART